MPQVPGLNSSAGLSALRGLLSPQNLLGSLSAMGRKLGPIFQLRLPRFSPFVLSGSEAAHFTLVEGRNLFHWRNETDPVTSLLRHGVLVEDGQAHDDLRRQIMPALHRKQVEGYIEKMWKWSHAVTISWQPVTTYNMLVEMRRLALLIVMDTLFAIDMTPDLDRILPAILDILKFISPGVWLLGARRKNFTKSIAAVNAYLEGLIHQRQSQSLGTENLLDQLISNGMEVGLIRDQMLTLLIAGHDTSTALLAWALYLIGKYPDIQSRLAKEAGLLPPDQPPSIEQVSSLGYYEQVINETLRLYPPIHVGNRVTQADLSVCGYTVPQDSRVMLSYYSIHHDENHWPEPEQFDPEPLRTGREAAALYFPPVRRRPSQLPGGKFCPGGGQSGVGVPPSAL